MPLSATDKLVLEKIDNAFANHPATGEQAQRYTQVRDMARSFAYLIAELCPDSPEREVALTHLETTVMFANAAIARHSTVH